MKLDNAAILLLRQPVPIGSKRKRTIDQGNSFGFGMSETINNQKSLSPRAVSDHVVQGAFRIFAIFCKFFYIPLDHGKVMKCNSNVLHCSRFIISTQFFSHCQSAGLVVKQLQSFCNHATQRRRV